MLAQATAAPPRAEWPGLGLLAAAVLFGAVFLWPETRIGRVPLNDSVFHLAAAERLLAGFQAGEPLLDPWVSEWALGYPLWRTYQPLPHAAAAVLIRSLEPLADHAAAFAGLQYLLLVLLPASAYLGARLLGLEPTAAGLASLLVLAPSGARELGLYGLGYGSYTWRGSGLYTQLVALHVLCVTLGLAARALDSGRRRPWASVLLAVTVLSHVVFGYVAAVSLVVLAGVGPTGQRARRLLRLVTIALPALALTAWFSVPLVLARHEINHSRWEAAFKWESFGAAVIFREGLAGRLLDAGRFPSLSLLALLGAAVAVGAVREALPRRLLALTAVWLALYCGRPTWGNLLLLAGVPGDLHLHRLQAAFELCAVLLAAWGTDRALRRLRDVSGRWAVAAAASVAALLVPVALDRAAYLRQNQSWGEQSLAAVAAEQDDLAAAIAEVRTILTERPGRASAGLAAQWGGQFKVGAVPLFTFLTRAHVDQASFLYHSLSSTSDLMVLRSEENLAHARAFGIRAVVAPVDRPMLHLRRRAQGRRLAVYEASPEGYFGLVDVGGRHAGPRSTFYETSAAWLKSPLLRAGVVIALSDVDHPPAGAEAGLPILRGGDPLPPLDPAFTARRGEITREWSAAGAYGARVSIERACHVLLKVTWHPDLVATIDGAPAAMARVTPGFGAIPVAPGSHEVVVRYQPGPLKPVLLVLGLVLFATSALVFRSGRWLAREEAWAARLAAWADRRRAG